MRSQKDVIDEFWGEDGEHLITAMADRIRSLEASQARGVVTDEMVKRAMLAWHDANRMYRAKHLKVIQDELLELREKGKLTAKDMSDALRICKKDLHSGEIRPFSAMRAALTASLLTEGTPEAAAVLAAAEAVEALICDHGFSKGVGMDDFVTLGTNAPESLSDALTVFMSSVDAYRAAKGGA